MASISSRWNGKARHAGGKSHAEWFAMEDELTGDWDPRHDLAFHDLPGAKRRMAIAFYNGCDYHFTGSIPFDLKQSLQRPRPWQAALMMGLPSPEHRRSISAWSPSAVSGHGFQGLMGCVAIQASLGLSGRAYGELVRMAVDIGDRRVYAGVHFPSDNAMSWRVALDALHEIGDTALHRFASEAVRGSEIYQAMQHSAGHSACIALVDQRLI